MKSRFSIPDKYLQRSSANPSRPYLLQTYDSVESALMPVRNRTSIREIQTTLEKVLQQWDASRELLEPLFEAAVLTVLEKWQVLHDVAVRFEFDEYMDGWKMSIEDDDGTWLDWTCDFYRDDQVESFL